MAPVRVMARSTRNVARSEGAGDAPLTGATSKPGLCWSVRTPHARQQHVSPTRPRRTDLRREGSGVAAEGDARSVGPERLPVFVSSNKKSPTSVAEARAAPGAAVVSRLGRRRPRRMGPPHAEARELAQHGRGRDRRGAVPVSGSACPDQGDPREEVKASERRRNRDKSRIHWLFAVDRRGRSSAGPILRRPARLPIAPPRDHSHILHPLSRLLKTEVGGSKVGFRPPASCRVEEARSRRSRSTSVWPNAAAPWSAVSSPSSSSSTGAPLSSRRRTSSMSPRSAASCKSPIVSRPFWKPESTRPQRGGSGSR